MLDQEGVQGVHFINLKFKCIINLLRNFFIVLIYFSRHLLAPISDFKAANIAALDLVLQLGDLKL